MPVLLLVTQSASLQEEIKTALSMSTGDAGSLIPCSSMEQGIEIQASLSENVLWLMDASCCDPSNLPPPQSGILLLTEPDTPSADGIPCLECPIRPRELAGLLSFLCSDATRPESGFTRSGIEVFVHDLNNRLTTVSGYLSLLPELMEGEEEMIQEMEQAMRDAEALIENLLQNGAPANHQK